MPDSPNFPLFSATIIALLGTGVMGGVFFAFSSFIMPALGRIPVPEGIRAMQRINVDVYHWSFMGPFFGIPLLCVGLAVLAVLDWGAPATPYLFGGSVTYVVGCFGVTAAANVPRNKALAAVDPDSTAGAEVWKSYLREWVWWNHVRTAACVVATGVLGAALAV